MGNGGIPKLISEIDSLLNPLEGLTLEDADLDFGSDLDIRNLVDWIQSGNKAKKIMVLSGAGVSVAAGIPDFRTPGTGLYDNLQKYNLPYPQAVFDVSFYRSQPQPFVTLAKELWPGLTHSPTLTHSFLKMLSDKGLLLRLYSQNIDGLEYLAGIPDEKLVECHGHFRSASCIECGTTADPESVKNTIIKDVTVPKCDKCGGNVKPDIVFFGESLPDRFHQMLRTDVEEADLLLVMGTSLQVAPVSMIPDMVRCEHRVLFNREPVMKIRTGKDLFLPGNCDDQVMELCSILGWKQDLLEENAKVQINNSSNFKNDEGTERKNLRKEPREKT
ncbi:unnamed protein product [Cylindrotheca closterium]|uniref:NAD-dependent protein deacetylase n=1 Tax=Cylindrotheca closterium TaxID=2856 RepID=A0AAD2FFV2_9STRA|nr:unnamed protein product [Cylindrotheca closterium]